jgi:hypothetical protein
MQPTRIEFDMTRKDLTAAARVTFAQDGVIQKLKTENRQASLILIGIGLLLGGGLIYFEPPPFWDGMAVGLLLIWLGAISWPSRKKVAGVANDTVNKAIGDPAYRMALGWHAVELRSDCLMLEVRYGRSEVDWRAIVRTHLDDDYLTLTLIGPIIVPIPRTAFKTDTEFDEFVAEVYRLIEAGGGNVGDSPPGDTDGAVPE